MSMKLTIYKVGGKIINDEVLLNLFLDEIAKTNTRKIIVHGGGNKASELMQRTGLIPKMVEGRRITDAAALEIVTMVYGGLINKNIVAKLQSRGINAIGLSGADANIIHSHKREVRNIDFGYVGDIDIVNGKTLWSLCENNMVPVLCPLTHDKEGQILNTNADTIASKVAISLCEFANVDLIYGFELKGVLKEISNENSLIERLCQLEMVQLYEKGFINDGMIPKLKNGFDALEGGVRSVSIRHIDEINLPEAGTTLIL